MRVLDFFPLDHWITSISKFFENNITDILEYMKEHMSRDGMISR